MTKTVRWGLIGCGDIVRKRVAAALAAATGSEILAVSRARSELAAESAREIGAQRAYAEWRDLLADPEIDAVYIATPVNLHARQTIAAAEAGKHVLCEKPMALSTAECESMIAACETHGVTLGVAYYRRFYPVIRRLKEIIDGGGIGRAVLAQANAFERFDVPPGAPRSWLLDPSQSGGGPMMDFGCHRIEILLDLLGAVANVQSDQARVIFERAVEETSIALIAHASGARSVLTVTHAVREPQDTISIYGSEGSLHIAPLNEGTLRIVSSSGEQVETHPPDANLHRPLVEDFVAALREGRKPEVSGETGLEVNRVLAAIYRQTAPQSYAS